MGEWKKKQKWLGLGPPYEKEKRDQVKEKNEEKRKKTKKKKKKWKEKGGKKEGLSKASVRSAISLFAPAYAVGVTYQDNTSLY